MIKKSKCKFGTQQAKTDLKQSQQHITRVYFKLRINGYYNDLFN
jgi:hypothetical protein